jgi:hypothetical protein
MAWWGIFMKVYRALILALALTLGCFSAALAQELIIANGTGFTIHQLGLADSNASGDAEDLLGDGTLAAGDGIKINLSGSSNGWELIAVDGDGNQVNWQNLNLTGVQKIVLHADGTADLQ